MSPRSRKSRQGGTLSIRPIEALVRARVWIFPDAQCFDAGVAWAAPILTPILLREVYVSRQHPLTSRWRELYATAVRPHRRALERVSAHNPFIGTLTRAGALIRYRIHLPRCAGRLAPSRRPVNDRIAYRTLVTPATKFAAIFHARFVVPPNPRTVSSGRTSTHPSPPDVTRRSRLIRLSAATV